MIIDGHGHACGPYQETSILNYMAEKGIDKVVLCPGAPDGEKYYNIPWLSRLYNSDSLAYIINRQIRLSASVKGLAKYIDKQNEMIGHLHQMHSDKIYQCYWVNPLDERFLAKLEKSFLRFRFPMVKLHQCWHRFALADENIGRIVRWCEGRDLSLFIHLYSKEQVREFIGLANQYPEVSFIVGHMIGFREIYSGCRYDNVFFDVSSPQLYGEMILKEAVELIGVKRLILGSDIPYGEGDIFFLMEELEKLVPYQQAREQIFSRNMIRLLARAKLYNTPPNYFKSLKRDRNEY